MYIGVCAYTYIFICVYVHTLYVYIALRNTHPYMQCMPLCISEIFRICTHCYVLNIHSIISYTHTHIDIYVYIHVYMYVLHTFLVCDIYIHTCIFTYILMSKTNTVDVNCMKQTDIYFYMCWLCIMQILHSTLVLLVSGLYVCFVHVLFWQYMCAVYVTYLNVSCKNPNWICYYFLVLTNHSYLMHASLANRMVI
jgi:hypothetical protein